MNVLREQLSAVQLAFARLTQREQFIVLVGGVASMMLLLLLVGWGISSSISSAENRVKVKRAQLEQVLELEGQYRSRLAESEERLNRLKRSKVRLVSIVEKAAKETGVEIGRLQPEEGQPNDSGVVTSRVDLRASGISVDRLQDFLKRLENQGGVVVVERLEVQKPYRKDTLNLELTLTTYRHEDAS